MGFLYLCFIKNLSEAQGWQRFSSGEKGLGYFVTNRCEAGHFLCKNLCLRTQTLNHSKLDNKKTRILHDTRSWMKWEAVCAGAFLIPLSMYQCEITLTAASSLHVQSDYIWAFVKISQTFFPGISELITSYRNFSSLDECVTALFLHLSLWVCLVLIQRKTLSCRRNDMNKTAKLNIFYLFVIDKAVPVRLS